MRRRLAGLVVVTGAFFMFAGPAQPFSVVHPVTGKCRQILIPGPDTFPGNWAVVSATPAAGPRALDPVPQGRSDWPMTPSASFKPRVRKDVTDGG